MPDNDSLTRLQELLRELFQLDLADLDFGLYRIFRIKQQEVEAFLSTQLPAEVNAAFTEVADEDKAKLAKHVQELAIRVRQNVADDAVLPDGQPNPAYANIRIVGDYREAREHLARVEASEAHRADVFNHLYAFFSRYYDDGDFIPRRFFGSRPAYAVPYNGEEVFFHWANKDQYYVKSGEHFRDYAFLVPTPLGEYRVRFRVVQATTAKDNVKGETRYFFPLTDQITYDEATRTLVIPFEYRVATEEEKQEYGRNSKARDAILDAYEPRILAAVTDAALFGALSAPQPTGGEQEGEVPPTLLRKRLAHFTRKRTSDFFVHKNLAGFLRQELEFYIRDQVVHELDLEGDVDAKRRMLRVFRRVAETIITFLASIEDAQKRLFEKKKLVLRTDWLAPISRLPRELWSEVLANEAQLAEWRELYALEPRSDLFQTAGAITEETLERHPTLVVDTRHFSRDFARRLLESVPDIDDWTDGVLFHSENFQALSLMQERYREQIKCIYIDPPYNTGNDEFLYRDDYQHSSWLTLMENRVAAAQVLMARAALFFCSIDDVEQAKLRLLLDAVLGAEDFVASVAWWRRHGRNNNAKLCSDVKDFVVWYRASDEVTLIREGRTDSSDTGYANPDNDPRGPWTSISYVNPAGKHERPNLVYPIRNPFTGEEVVHPTNAWKYSKEENERHIRENRLYWGIGGAHRYPRLKIFLADVGGLVPMDVWRQEDAGTTDEATRVLEGLFGRKMFSNPKPPRLIEKAGKCTPSQQDDGQGCFLDYFAGSGTTGHAVINLNREDGGRRKFILVEMAEYFDTVLIPRIKKVMFTPEWKDGKPKRMATSEEAERTPRLVKVLRLESYEDALHNTYAEKNLEAGEERAKAVKTHAGADAYRVRYMLRLPMDTSESMVSVHMLEHPWEATIEVLTDYGAEPSPVDLPETFLWLYGLRLHTVGTWTNADDPTSEEPHGRIYRYYCTTDREGTRRVLVVWRDMTDFDAVKDRAFLEAKAAELGTFEEKLVNGDTCAEGFASLNPLFKRLMDTAQ